jgi:predicted acetyltransferase
MAILPRYGPPDGDAEMRRYAAMAGQAFAGDFESFETWLRSFGRDVRLLREGDVLGGLVFYDMGQYFGGRPVRTWGVAGVAVRPELRAGGLGRELLQAHLNEHFENGPPISTLYPAAPKLYRGFGWEYGGSRISYVARLAELPQHETCVVFRPAVDADAELIAGLYARRVKDENGCLDRSEGIWKRLRRTPDGNPLFAYIAERDGVPEGYVLYTQRRESVDTFRFNILCKDVVCLTLEAAQALVAFFARHRSVANHWHFLAAPHDPLLLHTLVIADVQVQQRLDWMLRIVRVKDALELRGYSPLVTAGASISVRDAALPGNQGNWTLALEGGEMRVKRGGKGGPKIDVRGLAALYASRMTPSNLRAAGMLEGSEKHDKALAAMFAGPQPWMPDFF